MKSTFSYEFGSWLSSAPRNCKVLWLDFDFQKNLTRRTKLHDNNCNANNILLGKPVKIRHVPGNKNADIVEGSMLMDKAEDAIIGDKDKYLKLVEWLVKNKQTISKYDYLIIDCHPGLGRAAANAALASDLVISPIIPAPEGFDSKYDLAARVKLLSQEVKKTTPQLADIKIDYILTMLTRTKLSKMLVSSLGDDSDVIAQIPEREIFRKASAKLTSLAALRQNKSVYGANKAFFRQMDKQFNSVKKAIDGSDK